MSKIVTIKIENLKAISAIEANFKGCTAIITGGNNQGKSTLLRSLPDRIRFIRPNVIVKEGSTQGKGEMTLDTGEKFIWEFNSTGKDVIKYVTEKGISTTLTKELGKRFFPPVFDIDVFLQSQPKDQKKQLQQALGIDTTDVDNRYSIAFADRTTKNKEAEYQLNKLNGLSKVEPCEPVDLADLIAQKEVIRNDMGIVYRANVAANEQAKKEWEHAKRDIDIQVTANHATIARLDEINATLSSYADAFHINGYPETGKLRSWIEATFITPPKLLAHEMYPIEPICPDPMPDNTKLAEIDDKILKASETNQKANNYKNYLEQKQLSEKATQSAKDADTKVKEIEVERKKLIESAKMPKGMAFTETGITVDGLPLDKNQLSTSKYHIAALQIAAMNLGEVKMLYFDISALDRNNLNDIQAWAESEGLQLLMEKPAFEGGEITYNIIEETTVPGQPKLL